MLQIAPLLMYPCFFSCVFFRWVHVVCALYVPGVAFGDIDKLRPVTLTEMNYSKYGAKASTKEMFYRIKMMVMAIEIFC